MKMVREGGGGKNYVGFYRHIIVSLLSFIFEVMRNWSASHGRGTWLSLHLERITQASMMKTHFGEQVGGGGAGKIIRGYLRTRVKEDKDAFPVMAMEVVRTSWYLYCVEIGDNRICCLIECEE